MVALGSVTLQETWIQEGGTAQPESERKVGLDVDVAGTGGFGGEMWSEQQKAKGWEVVGEHE